MKNQYCPGCGIALQAQDPKAPGYVPRTKDGKLTVCQRCYKIMHYGRLTGGTVTEENFYHAIRTATGKADLTLLVADFFDLEGSFAPQWADLIKTPGRNPIKLIVNKADLIPPKTPREEVAEWVEDLWTKRFPQIGLKGVKVISARETAGLSSLLKELNGLSVAIVGAANVGKSSLLVKMIASSDQRGYTSRAHVKSPTISSFPGTTQGITHWRLKDTAITFSDTPGIIPNSRIGDKLCPECSARLLPNRVLQTKLWEIPADNAVLFGDLAGVWNNSKSMVTAIFFSAESLTLHRTNSKKALELLEESPDWLTMLCTTERKKFEYTEEVFAVKPGEDLYISGLGWLAVKKEIADLKIRVPSGVEIGVRPSLVGKK